MTPPARLAGAIDLLAAIEAAPRQPADAAASAWFRARRYIGSADRREISDRVWTLLRARRRLSWWLARAGAAPTPRLLVFGHELLAGRTLAALALFAGGGKFAPAALSAEEQAVLGRLERHTLDHPAMAAPVRLEFPDWLEPQLAARFGAALEAEMAALLAPAPLDLRVNLLKGCRAAARDALAAEGIAAEATPISPWGLRIGGRPAVTAGAAFRAGLVEIQAEGSQIVALLAGAAPGLRVADFCAGAGGKTLALAMMMENRGHIAALDVAKSRLDGAARRLRRAGVHNAEAHLLGPGDKFLKRRAGGFDRVLVDAPCTGTGTWRRNPEARHRLAPADLAEILPRQAAILADAAKLVRKGGRLVYATCSLLPAENEEQVSAFLARHGDFRTLPPAAVWPGPAACPAAGAFLSLSPRRHGTDGFFAAVLERVA